VKVIYRMDYGYPLFRSKLHDLSCSRLYGVSFGSKLNDAPFESSHGMTWHLVSPPPLTPKAARKLHRRIGTLWFCQKTPQISPSSLLTIIQSAVVHPYESRRMIVNPHRVAGNLDGRHRVLPTQISAESWLKQTHVKHDFRSEGFWPWVSMVAIGH